MRNWIFSLLIPSVVFAEPIKPYWDKFYTPIKECVLEEVKSSEIYKPAVKVETKQDLRNYLKSSGLEHGFYVLIDTEKITSQDVCFMKFVINQTGNKVEYFRPIEKLVIGSFTRKQDALDFEQKISKQFKLKSERIKLKEENILPIYENSPIKKDIEYIGNIEILRI